jgi:mono/diheme cytochrome c family protein
MPRFLFGFIAAIVIVLLAGFLWLRLGFVDSRADAPVNVLERSVAMPALDASVRRHASPLQNPVAATDDNLAAGMKIYQSNCASCHGDIHQTNSVLGDSLYPKAPQFLEDAPDMPEYQNFYIIQHGIRLSAMPASRFSLKDEEIWQVTTFLSHMDKLPPQVSEQWKALAAESAKR